VVSRYTRCAIANLQRRVGAESPSRGLPTTSTGFSKLLNVVSRTNLGSRSPIATYTQCRRCMGSFEIAARCSMRFSDGWLHIQSNDAAASDGYKCQSGTIFAFNSLLRRPLRKEVMMKRLIAPGIVAAVLALGLAGCTNPYDPGQRAVGGGLLGAGAGAAIGGAVGGGHGAALGAAIGGATGAVTGAATTPPPPPPPGAYGQGAYGQGYGYPPPPAPSGYGYPPAPPPGYPSY